MKRPGVVPEWVAAAEVRRSGAANPEIANADLRRVWIYACLTRHVEDIERVVARFEVLWDSLPDFRLRECGNGRRLRYFLDQSTERPMNWGKLFHLPVPRTRPND